MNVLIAILVVGLGSMAFRLLPLLGARRISDRLEETLTRQAFTVHLPNASAEDEKRSLNELGTTPPLDPAGRPTVSVQGAPGLRTTTSTLRVPGASCSVAVMLFGLRVALLVRNIRHEPLTQLMLSA